MKKRNNTWRFLDTGKGSAVFNMAVDETIMHMLAGGVSQPTFRIYGWDPPAITLGYSQEAADHLDVMKCRADGIDITQRPTGGRAVYHDNEIAYSVVASIDDPFFGGTIMETYNSISRLLCKALNELGVNAVLSRGNPGNEKTRHEMKEPCFLSVSRHEITCGGKKIVGSAQRRYRDVFLQHGSILTGSGQEKIADYSKDQVQVQQAANLLKRRATNIQAVTGNECSAAGFKAVLYNVLNDDLDTEVVCSGLSPKEIVSVEQSVQEKVNTIT